MTAKFLSGADIAPAIAAVAPKQIAVAYLGRDWRKYLPSDLDSLESIVVAPVLGTNPLAVQELVKALGPNGWDRVFFLDSLHAKVYVGHSAAVYGSANLTNNGLSGQGLLELCAITNDRHELKYLASFVVDVVQKAKLQYSTTEAKLKRLAELVDAFNRNPSFSIGGADVAFEDFELLPNHFYLSWYVIGKPTYNSSLSEEALYDSLLLHPSDNVQLNKWVLVWRCNQDWSIGADLGLRWMMIDECFSNGATSINDEETEYTKVIAELKSLNALKRKPPFKITKQVKLAFRGALEQEDGKLRKALQSDKLMELQKVLPALIEAMRSQLKS
jgi:hypothetical protein